MANIRSAKRYATAIFNYSKEENAVDVIIEDMKSITETVSASKDLRSLLSSPIVKQDKKVASLKEIFPNANPLTFKLVDVLAANKRIDLLASTATQFIELYQADKGFQKAFVTTAIPLTDDMSSKVLAKVKSLTGKEAIIENTVDENIIGGFILRVGDVEYNASIANKFNNLKRTFSQN